MTDNLLADAWTNLDSAELRLLLSERIPGPGQYDGEGRSKLYLPLAGTSCRLVLTYRDRRSVRVEPYPDRRIVRVERGLAFDVAEWDRIREEIETSILVGPLKIGRAYSFTSFRVSGSWRGNHSGVQILQPPANAPQSPYEAEHPFILEFPITGCKFLPITNHRRLRQHRKLTLLLNVLLVGHTSFQPRRSKHFWACVDDESTEIKWVKQCYFAELGEGVSDQLSPFVGEPLEEIEPEAYYARGWHDGKGLRLPTDLDDSICLYFQLSPSNRAKLDRAMFWMDMASRQWNISVSASFAALVSAIESLTKRGDKHQFKCPICGKCTEHEVPGATRRFRDFFDIYAPSAAMAERRKDMYSLRSGILHGSELMQLDQDLAFGWDPPGWNEGELHDELWALTRIAIRNWLKNPPAN